MADRSRYYVVTDGVNYLMYSGRFTQREEFAARYSTKKIATAKATGLRDQMGHVLHVEPRGGANG